MLRSIATAALFLVACSDIPLEPTLTSLDANVFGPKCTRPCHAGGFYAGGGLDMSHAWSALVDVPAQSRECEESEMMLVVPGDPVASLLYLKVWAKAEGDDPVCGEGMPSGIRRAALSREEIDAIGQWIADGAPAN